MLDTDTKRRIDTARDNYLSQKDIDICLASDFASLAGHEHYAGIRQLHDALIAGYETDDDCATKSAQNFEKQKEPISKISSILPRPVHKSDRP